MNEFEWRRQMRELRKPVAPTRDLWDSIEARLEQSPAQPVSSAKAAGSQRVHRRTWLAAASLAALFLLAGGVAWHLQQQRNTAADVAMVPTTTWKPSDPRLAGAAIELSSAQMELRQALQQAPGSPALQRLLSRTEQQQTQLHQLEHQAG